MLHDLAHSAAHDERDKGYAFDYLQGLVNELSAANEGRTALLEVVVAYPIAAVLKELNAVLKAEQIGVQLPLNDDRTNFTAARAFGQALDGTTFKLKRATAHLEMRTEGRDTPLFGMVIAFAESFLGHGGVSIGVPWLLGIDPKTGDTLGT